MKQKTNDELLEQFSVDDFNGKDSNEMEERNSLFRIARVKIRYMFRKVNLT